MSRLEGRSALVTGGAGGLGTAIVERLRGEGAHVAVLDIGLPPDASPEPQAGILRWRTDVTNEDEAAAAVEATVRNFGGLDILVNNAGLLSGRAPFAETDQETFLRFLTVNAVGYHVMARAAVPALTDSSHGRVINVASRTFFTGSPGQMAYVASKGAVLGMTRVLARELGPQGITVNAAMPGMVPTPGTRAHSDDEAFARMAAQQAIPRQVQPADFAGLVAFLASDDAAMITGQAILCDGGGYLH
ncbi:MAG: SDR family oxidoreductase [Streptosporangiales bacterium]|nr:SDR family oxidoreductase [Streptosporangiales bacterium]